MRPDRRKFIKDTICAAMGGASVFSALGQMQLLQAASRANSANYTDYKALVCVFLYGGNDSFNTVVPYSGAARTGTTRRVPPAARRSTSPRTHCITLNAPTGTAARSPGDSERIWPASDDVRSCHRLQCRPRGHRGECRNAGATDDASRVLNAGNTPLPPQLFSHSDQTAYWQSSPPSNQPITGWGGRSPISSPVPTPRPAVLCRREQPDTFMRGQLGEQLRHEFLRRDAVTLLLVQQCRNGVRPMRQRTQNWTDNGPVSAYCNLHAANAQAHSIERTFATTMQHSISTAGIINAA